MCKFESSQKDESRAQLADSWKAYSKPRAFNCCLPETEKTKHKHNDYLCKIYCNWTKTNKLQYITCTLL